jgi:hypothetical protein
MQLKEDDFYYCGAENNDRFHYMLAMHKSARLIDFAITKNLPESKMLVHRIWVDQDAKGRYQILDEGQTIKIIPAEFVRAKYSQAMYYFSIYEDVQNKLRSSKPEDEQEQNLQELQSETDLHLIRLVRSLTHDLRSIEHIDETMDNKLSLTIRNIANNNDMFLPGSDLTRNDDWLHLTFSNNNYYYLDEMALQENDNNILYHMAIHKTLSQLKFARAASSEFKTTSIHHLYISQDDGLGRYKVQTNDGIISKQFFVPVCYVMDRCDRFRGFMNNFKKVQDKSDGVYARQTIWCKLQDDAILIINYIISELERDLKQKIDKSLVHHVESLAFSIQGPKNFEDFYNFVVQTEKRIRLEFREKTYPNNLVIFNRHDRTISIIHMDNLENDIFSMAEKVKILVSKYDPDYYVMVGETWTPKNQEIQQRVSMNYRHGDIVKLSSHEKKEVLIFMAKTKNSINPGPDKFEQYEIIREKQNDEESKILELRKFGNGSLKGAYQDLISTGA